FRVRASLAHENPGDKGDRVRLKIRGHHRPKCWSSVGVFAIRLRINSIFTLLVINDLEGE
ncbi:hypothetical protein, partial [Pseudomonas amygdali]|uniref:hypothetical protein n=1 Tax=Pseudomonas amygdali TaxID=47877 RepID=UPI001FB7EB08